MIGYDEFQSQTKKTIETVREWDSITIKKKCNELLERGGIISSTSSSWSEDNDDVIWLAVFVMKEKA